MKTSDLLTAIFEFLIVMSFIEILFTLNGFAQDTLIHAISGVTALFLTIATRNTDLNAASKGQKTAYDPSRNEQSVGLRWLNFASEKIFLIILIVIILENPGIGEAFGMMLIVGFATFPIFQTMRSERKKNTDI